jgi:hypothetical protein
VYAQATAYSGPAGWTGTSDDDEAEYTLNANKIAANVLNSEGALELIVAKQRFLSERFFNYGHLQMRGVHVWESGSLSLSLKTPNTVSRVDLGDGCNSTALLAAATSAQQNGGVAVFALEREVDLNEHGRFRATVTVSAATAASASIGLELELLDLGAHASGDALSDEVFNRQNGLPPLFAMESDGSNMVKIGPEFRADAAERATHGRLRSGASRGPLMLRDLQQRALPAAFA